ncbi:MAG: type II toxin-antitoxin system RelE/ParE family toxin [Planctomycetes bacterium]|nr:type II toxin-antitoxin system RelE/ParE family toxin [Planctomycetota bacterium]
MKQYGIEEYADRDGKMPFRDWLLRLKDVVARAKLTARIDRAAHGNFGDWKTIKNAPGVFEMREHCGPGYRIFYAVIGQKIVLLLAGSAKRDQKKAIALAKQRLADYEERKKNDGSPT